MNMNPSLRPTLRSLASLGMVALAATACSSSSTPSHNGPNTSPPATTLPSTTTSPGPGGGVTGSANALCGQLSATLSTLGHLNFNSLSGLVGASKTLTSDFTKLEVEVSSLQQAGKSGQYGSQVKAVAAQVQQAVSSAQAAAKAGGAGNLGTTKDDLAQAQSHLSQAEQLAANTHLGNCAAPTATTTAAGSTTTG